MTNRPTLKVMGKLIKLIKPLTPHMILAILMGVAGFLSAISITVLGGYAILSILGVFTKLTLKTIFILLISFAVLRGILRYTEQACNHYIAFKMLALIRDKAYKALRRLAPAKLEGRDKGDLISLITSDIELLEVFYAHTISPIFIALLLTIVLVAFVGSFNVLLGALALLAYFTVGVIVPYVASKQTKEIGQNHRKNVGNISSFFLDSMRGIKESIQYSDGDNRLNKIKQHTQTMSQSEHELKKKASTSSAITNTLIVSFSVIMFIASSLLYIKGKVDIAGVIIPTITMFSSFGAVIAVANLGAGLSQTIASGNRVLDILEEAPIIDEVTSGKDIDFKGAKFDDVNFAYMDEKILENFNLQIKENKVTCITGKSGSGKSTMLKLLMRFWDTNTGEIKMSDKDIKKINTRSLRDNESFVTQETHLFHDSIENNIKIAKLDASHDEVVKACKKASIHKFVKSLPNGYDTEVGELGDTLSGGERQRIGLARAFLHNAPLLLLDEPTSNLDSLNEAVILKAIKKDENRTTVLVSHRESTKKIADEYFCVEHGRMS